MKKYLSQEQLKDFDEAWLVVDKDQWSDDQINQLYAWSRTSQNYGFALSNPAFEFWLLLHFEDGSDIRSLQDCRTRLKRYLPEYNKEIDVRKFTDELINNAVHRARQRDTPPCSDWPRALGVTTVYKLVTNLLKD